MPALCSLELQEAMEPWEFKRVGRQHRVAAPKTLQPWTHPEAQADGATSTLCVFVAPGARAPGTGGTTISLWLEHAALLAGPF